MGKKVAANTNKLERKNKLKLIQPFQMMENTWVSERRKAEGLELLPFLTCRLSLKGFKSPIYENIWVSIFDNQNLFYLYAVKNK